MKDCVSSFEGYKKQHPEFIEEISCVENYLNLYDWFTQDPNNKNIKTELYNETLKMLKRGQYTKRKQGKIALQQSEELAKRLVNKYSDTFNIENDNLEINYSKLDELPDEDKALSLSIKLIQEEMSDIVKDSVNALKDMLKKCEKSDTSKVGCIETFVHSAHNRGPFIPLGCGLPYPEFIEYLTEEEEERINLVGEIMAKETINALDCIANRKDIKT